jgi:outer membrane receptor protein involved in Fe transport
VDVPSAITPVYYETKMDPFVDLNIGVDYRYSKNLSAFIQLNNLANNRYDRFVNYPVYGINILGGFTFTF